MGLQKVSRAARVISLRETPPALSLPKHHDRDETYTMGNRGGQVSNRKKEDRKRNKAEKKAEKKRIKAENDQSKNPDKAPASNPQQEFSIAPRLNLSDFALKVPRPTARFTPAYSTGQSALRMMAAYAVQDQVVEFGGFLAKAALTGAAYVSGSKSIAQAGKTIDDVTRAGWRALSGNADYARYTNPHGADRALYWGSVAATVAVPVLGGLKAAKFARGGELVGLKSLKGKLNTTLENVHDATLGPAGRFITGMKEGAQNLGTHLNFPGGRAAEVAEGVPLNLMAKLHEPAAPIFKMTQDELATRVAKLNLLDDIRLDRDPFAHNFSYFKKLIERSKRYNGGKESFQVAGAGLLSDLHGLPVTPEHVLGIPERLEQISGQLSKIRHNNASAVGNIFQKSFLARNRSDYWSAAYTKYSHFIDEVLPPSIKAEDLPHIGFADFHDVHEDKSRLLLAVLEHVTTSNLSKHEVRLLDAMKRKAHDYFETLNGAEGEMVQGVFQPFRRVSDSPVEKAILPPLEPVAVTPEKVIAPFKSIEEEALKSIRASRVSGGDGPISLGGNAGGMMPALVGVTPSIAKTIKTAKSANPIPENNIWRMAKTNELLASTQSPIDALIKTGDTSVPMDIALEHSTPFVERKFPWINKWRKILSDPVDTFLKWRDTRTITGKFKYIKEMDLSIRKMHPLLNADREIPTAEFMREQIPNFEKDIVTISKMHHDARWDFFPDVVERAGKAVNFLRQAIEHANAGRPILAYEAVLEAEKWASAAENIYEGLKRFSLPPV